MADDGRARLGQAERPADRLSGRLLLRRAQGEAEARLARRGRSRNPAHLRKARHPDRRAEAARRRRGGRTPAPDRGRCGVRQRLGRHHLPRRAGEGGGHLPLDLRGDPRISGHGEAVAGQGRPRARQLLRDAQQRGLLRRHLRVHSRRRALPDGTQHLFPDQRRQYRPVRTHADRRRQGQLRLLSGRLHRADARREPAARRGGGTGRARRCRDQVQHRPELVSRRRRRQGRHLQFRHQARAVPGQEQQGQLDAGRDRLRGDVEIPVLRAGGREQRRRVLLGRGDQQPATGRYRHQDDPSGQGQPLDDRCQGHFGGPVGQHLSRPRPRRADGGGRAQLHPVRFAAARRSVRRAHHPLYRDPQSVGADRA